jgi:hypothetical protein
VIQSKHLGKVRSGWDRPKDVLTQNLQVRGWLDPTAGQRRAPLYIAAAVLFVLAVVGIVFLAAAEQVWALIAVIALGGASLFAFIAALLIPSRTPDGDRAAAPWLDYQHTLKQASKRDPAFIDLDRDMPYAVSFGVASSLDKQLKAASATGYVPAWLYRAEGLTNPGLMGANGYYPVWIAFSSGVSPTSSGTSSSSSASSGSGSAGGSF